MKLAICASASGVDAPVDGRFGRCPYFVLVEPETDQCESIANPATSAGGGAGSEAARCLSDRDVNVVVVGNVGPNAAMVLNAMGIEIYSGAEGTVKETLDLYRKGKLSRISDPTVPSHFGTGRGQGRRG